MQKAKQCVSLVVLMLLICFPATLPAQQAVDKKATAEDLTDGQSQTGIMENYNTTSYSILIH